ncbi:hypothetical protein RHSIM_Rhsim07G0162100 [Rhododendron simsii]|uniref:Uncharacterized protein n=1 Tax=Rhododendron simsii TaxID=118357 RepID=A0A834GNW7_RHOSS|nr:hypothetical protein RHSIM_Rhsim07G0162100 [Rhododendron simsii]
METDRQEESVMPPPTVQQPRMLCESSANSSQALYTPQVKNDLIPKINQEFDSLQKVKEFYNRYAKEGGFGTQEHSSRKRRDNENVIVRKEFNLLFQTRVDGSKKYSTTQTTSGDK